MLGGFPTLTHNIFSTSLLPWELLSTLLQNMVTCILTGWPLSLSIRATIGSRINKAFGREQHRQQEMKTMTRANKPISKCQQLDFTGPCTEAVELSLLSMSENQTEAKTRSRREANKGKEGRITRSRESGAAEAFLVGVLGAKHLSSIPSILSKANTVGSSFSFPDEETKNQRSGKVISKDTQLLRTGFEPRSVCLLGPEASHNTT